MPYMQWEDLLMITVEQTFSPPSTYPLERIGQEDRLLFFDIETTGFSPASSSLYLIGCTYRNKDAWNLIQWFADSREAEKEVLLAFSSFIKSFDTLVHFNGDGFDIPYLTKRYTLYHLPSPFEQIRSFDIYKKIRPYKKLLGLDSLKQKAIESFLGIHRTDQYSGGQLIDVYYEYLINHDSMLYHLLMLHNEEDLKGMPFILPILLYPDFLNSRFLPESHQFAAEGLCLILQCRSNISIPTSIAWEHPTLTGVSLEGKGSRISIRIPVFEGELKYFYPDYKNYYYLIYEDTAIHKSVGEFVDRCARKQATSSTCYSRKTGRFLPQAEPVLSPVFRRQYRDKCLYCELPLSLSDCSQMADYTNSLIATSLPSVRSPF